MIATDGGPVRELTAARAPAGIQTLWGAAWSADDCFLYFARRPNGNSAYEPFRIPAAGGAEESAD